MIRGFFRFLAREGLVNNPVVASLRNPKVSQLAPDHRLALKILESPQPLDLLITDVVMPAG